MNDSKAGIFRGGMDDTPKAPNALAVALYNASHPLARAISLHLADRGEWVLAFGDEPNGLRDLPRETAMGGLIEVSSQSSGSRAAVCQALFERLDALVIVCELPARALFAAFESHSDTLANTFTQASAGPLTFLQELRPLLQHSQSPRVLIVNAVPRLLLSPLSTAIHDAIEGFWTALRFELGVRGVAVSMVSPGLTRAPAHELSLMSAFEERLLHSPQDEQLRSLASEIRPLLAASMSHEQLSELVAQALRAPKPRPLYQSPLRKRLGALWAVKSLERKLKRAQRKP